MKRAIEISIHAPARGTTEEKIQKVGVSGKNRRNYGGRI